MTVKVGIPIEALDEETRQKLGLKLPPTVEQLGSSLARVGNVLKALKGLSYEDALRVLWHAERLLVSRQSPITQEENPYVPTIAWTLQVVSRVFDIDITPLKQHRRETDIALARQVCMYILVMTNGYTYTEIGQALGKRTPSTISHGFQTIARQLELGRNIQLKEKVAEIMMRLTGEEH